MNYIRWKQIKVEDGMSVEQEMTGNAALIRQENVTVYTNNHYSTKILISNTEGLNFPPMYY